MCRFGLNQTQHTCVRVCTDFSVALPREGLRWEAGGRLSMRAYTHRNTHQLDHLLHLVARDAASDQRGERD